MSARSPSNNEDDHTGLESSSNVSAPAAPIPIAVIENEQIYAAFENSIVQRVNQRLDEKLARRQATYIGAVAIIITVITAIGGYVGSLVLDLQVKSQVREQLAQEAAQVIPAFLNGVQP